MKTSRRPWFLLFGLLAIVLSTVLAFAQGGARGAILGTVKDASGAVIPGAKVEIINMDTNLVERTVTTGNDGAFRAAFLPVGDYKVVAEASGFAKTEVSSVPVRVTETANLVLTMKVGTKQETITVETAAAMVQLATAATGQTIVADTATALPLSTRNFLGLLSLSSGANAEIFDSAALGRGQVSINVNGQRPTNNNYQLEGINANDVNLPILDNVPLPNPDTIAEFKTQTSLYDASQGRNAGGNIQVNLRSGTDKYHGSVYEFFRNDVLNANDWFLKREQIANGEPNKPPVLRQNQFGASFGGPVPMIKDFFFFGNYQGTRAASGISAGTAFSLTTMPVLPTDRSAANLANIYFPGGFAAWGLPAGTQLDPVAVNYLNLPAYKCPGIAAGGYCIPSVAGTPGLVGSPDATAAPTVNVGSIARSGKGIYNEDQFTISIDKQLTRNDKITGRWFYSKNAQVQPYGTQSTLPFEMNFPRGNRFLKLGWTRVFSPNVVNDFRFGFNRFFFSNVPTEPITLADVGAIRGNSSVIPAAFRVVVSGLFSIGTNQNDDRGGHFNTFTWADDFSITRGKHMFRIGGDISRYQLNRYNRFSTRGSLSFTAKQAAGEPYRLNALQNFLLGRFSSSQGASGIYNFYFRATDFSAYLQDDWKIHPRLTLNLGVRWEGMSTAHEKFNHLSNFRGLKDNLPGPISIIHPEDAARVGTPGVSNCTLLDCLDTNNFAPRVGFSFDMFGNQKTVLRGGFGSYYQRVSNQALLQTAGGLPFAEAFSTSWPSATFYNPFPSSRPDSDFPLPYDQVVPALIGFNAITGAPIFNSASGAPMSGFYFFPARNFHAPYAMQWNLSVQHEVAQGWIAEVGYVGTRGVSLIGPGYPYNAGKICTAQNPCTIPASIGANVNVPAGTPYVTKQPEGTILITGSTAENIDARVPINYLGLANSRGFFNGNEGASVYHSLQTSLVHQFHNGLYLQAAYTFSKSIDNASGSAFGDELNGNYAFGDYMNTRSYRAVSDFDRRHRFALSYNYDLPLGKWMGVSDSGWGKLVNGWFVNGVIILQSGNPFTVVDSGALTLADTDGVNSANYATFAPGNTVATSYTQGSISSRVDAYLNKNAFLIGGTCVDSQNAAVSCSSAAAVASAVGNARRNAFRGPFQQSWDMSFGKSTKITERSAIDFRAEFFNIFNHPSFQPPGAGGVGSYQGNTGYVDIATGDSSISGTVTRPRIIQFAVKIRF
jgi:hypothetical protein